MKPAKLEPSPSKDARIRLAQKTSTLALALSKVNNDLKKRIDLTTEDVNVRKWFGQSDVKEHTTKKKETAVWVENNDVIAVIRRLSQKSSKPVLVLNCASDRKQGGGWMTGAQALEESLFRASTLCISLCPKYPWNRHAAFYSPTVQLVCDEKGASLDEKDQVTFSVFSVAGIRRPVLTNGKFSKADQELVTAKIIAFFQTAVSFGHSHVIATALGCGAFGGPQEQTAQIFSDVLSRFSRLTVCFAIKCEVTQKKARKKSLDEIFQAVLMKGSGDDGGEQPDKDSWSWVEQF